MTMSTSTTSLPPPTTNADLLQKLSRNTEGIVTAAKTTQLLPQLVAQMAVANAAIRDSIRQRNAELQRLQERENILGEERQVAEERSQALEAQVNELTTLLDSATTDRTDLQTRVNALTEQIKSLQSDMAAQTTRMEGAQQHISDGDVTSSVVIATDPQNPFYYFILENPNWAGGITTFNFYGAVTLLAHLPRISSGTSGTWNRVSGPLLVLLQNMAGISFGWRAGWNYDCFTAVWLDLLRCGPKLRRVECFRTWK